MSADFDAERWPRVDDVYYTSLQTRGHLVAVHTHNLYSATLLMSYVQAILSAEFLSATMPTCRKCGPNLTVRL